MDGPSLSHRLSLAGLLWLSLWLERRYWYSRSLSTAILLPCLWCLWCLLSYYEKVCGDRCSTGTVRVCTAVNGLRSLHFGQYCCTEQSCMLCSCCTVNHPPRNMSQKLVQPPTQSNPPTRGSGVTKPRPGSREPQSHSLCRPFIPKYTPNSAEAAQSHPQQNKSDGGLTVGSQWTGTGLWHWADR